MSRHAADGPDTARPERMPVLFVGHGSPMNAIEDNVWSRGFRELGRLLPRPAAILSVSAHWFVAGTWLTGDPQPRTLHDFGGFPPALYEVEYRAPGSVDLARNVRTILDAHGAALDTTWGLDHGTWSVLRWMYPDADIPVVQLSIDNRLGAKEHFDLARSLRDLRHQDILILGSGNVVHNLGDAIRRMGTENPVTPDWASRFDARVKTATEARDVADLLASHAWGGDGPLAHPTPDHWLPFIYALSVADRNDRVRFTNEGFDLGSLSMRCVVWG